MTDNLAAIADLTARMGKITGQPQAVRRQGAPAPRGRCMCAPRWITCWR
ncbi:hypothetical protein ACU4GD_39185 [Cupriavidus basilensis]